MIVMKLFEIIVVILISILVQEFYNIGSSNVEALDKIVIGFDNFVVGSGKTAYNSFEECTGVKQWVVDNIDLGIDIDIVADKYKTVMVVGRQQEDKYGKVFEDDFDSC